MAFLYAEDPTPSYAEDPTPFASKIARDGIPKAEPVRPAAAVRDDALEALRFEVLDPSGPNRARIVKALDDLASMDGRDPQIRSSDARAAELTKLAGSVLDPALAAGYTALVVELKAATATQSGVRRADTLFAQLARQASNLHAQIDDAAGTRYALKSSAAVAGVECWVALAEDHRAISARTRTLRSPLPDPLLKAAAYRRHAAALTDRALAAGYLALAEDLESTFTPKGNP